MQYFDVIFFTIFLPLVILFYTVFKKHRPLILLIASYIFFFSISGNLLFYLILSTLSIHHIGLWIQTINNDLEKELQTNENHKLIKNKYNKKKKRVIALALILHIGLLVILKYSSFITINLNSLLKLLSIDFTIKEQTYLIPIGISFYTLQGISYMVDVYRGKIKAEKSLKKLALFMSFFPIIMEGPICRYNDTANALMEGKNINYNNLTMGLQRCLYGALKKIVVADRLDIIVKTIFSGYETFDGGIIFLGAICYTIELYMEFSGTMDVILGVAQIFNIKLPENFRQPFFSKNISDFWSRWHITLGTFFKDYIYYPISLSKSMKKVTTFGRKILGNYYGPLLASAIALFAVWLCNGLWHGSAWLYIFFGMYHFLLILLENITEPLIRKITTKLHINRNNFIYHFFQIIKTTLLVIIGEMIFRSKRLLVALAMLKGLFTRFTLTSFLNGTYLDLGLDIKDFIIIGITLIIILIISILKEKGIQIRELIAKQNIFIRWTLYYALILFIIIFGAYGSGYVPVDPIYAGF